MATEFTVGDLGADQRLEFSQLVDAALDLQVIARRETRARRRDDDLVVPQNGDHVAARASSELELAEALAGSAIVVD